MLSERIVIPRIGGPDVLEFESLAATTPKPGEVAIRVAAIGINFADVFCRLGLYRAAPPRPFVPGFEVSGTVEQVGKGVTQFSVGERVIAVTRFGGYTTRLTVRADWMRRLPQGWSFAEGAAFPVVFLTAYHGLYHLGRLAPGERVVVQSAAGGVGTAACQLARARGARVIGTVGSEAKRSAAIASGADEVIVSRGYDVWDDVQRITGGDGVDLVFDAVGGRGLKHAFNALRDGGRLIVYGFAEMMPRGGRRNWPLLIWRYLRTPRFDPFRMVRYSRSVAGFNLVNLWRKDLFQAEIDALSAMVARNEIRPVIGRLFPFRNVGQAHEYLQSRESTGKLVLVCNEAPERAPFSKRRASHPRPPTVTAPRSHDQSAL